MKARIRLAATLALLPAALTASPFDRPTPMPQSATAEHWFAAASLALIAALFVVHRMVKSR